MNSLKIQVEHLEKTAITTALHDSNWIQAQAAIRLGITERMIGYKIKKYKIEIEKGTHPEVE